MCPEKQPGASLQRASSVEALPDPIPDLFNHLTAEADSLSRWTTHTYPAHLDLLYFNPENAPLDPQLSATGGSFAIFIGQRLRSLLKPTLR
jgi:Twisted gastrulation (Tsg) protein conserved region